ncbi:MAG: hypothetical protein SNJ84_04830, partial [Verrucomicrobiia bacterium]
MNRFLRSGQRGAALVLVLGLSAALLAPLIAFLVFLHGQSAHARAVRHSTNLNLLVEAALQEAMAKLTDGFTSVHGLPGQVPGSVTAAPGLMEVLRYDVPYHRGSETGSAAFSPPDPSGPFFTNPFAESYGGRPANPRWIPLYSRRWFAPGTKFLAAGPHGAPASVPNPHYNPEALFNFNTPDNPFRPGEFYLSGLPAEPAFPRREKNAEGWFPTVGQEAAFAFRPGEPASD